jgi:hypothetical protein
LINYKVTLTKEEREILMANTRKDNHTAKKVIHSIILLNVDQGPFVEIPQTNEEVCKVLKIGMRTIDRVKQRFVMEGLVPPWALPRQAGYSIKRLMEKLRLG